MRNSKNHASKQRQLIFRRRLAGIALWHPGDFQKESIKEKFLDCASFLKYGKLWNMCPHVSTWRPKKLRKIKQFRKHEDGVRMTSDTAELFCVKTKTKPEPLTEPRHQRSTHQVVNSHHRFTVTLLSLYCHFRRPRPPAPGHHLQARQARRRATAAVQQLACRNQFYPHGPLSTLYFHLFPAR